MGPSVHTEPCASAWVLGGTACPVGGMTPWGNDGGGGIAPRSGFFFLEPLCTAQAPGILAASVEA